MHEFVQTGSVQGVKPGFRGLNVFMRAGVLSVLSVLAHGICVHAQAMLRCCRDIGVSKYIKMVFQHSSA